MRILFDQGTPQPLRRQLTGHAVDTVYEMGWVTLKNGVLLTRAEQAGYDLFITTDQNLHYRQNLTRHRLAILVLGPTSWPTIRQRVARIQRAVDVMNACAYLEIPFDVSP